MIHYALYLPSSYDLSFVSVAHCLHSALDFHGFILSRPRVTSDKAALLSTLGSMICFISELPVGT